MNQPDTRWRWYKQVSHYSGRSLRTVRVSPVSRYDKDAASKQFRRTRFFVFTHDGGLSLEDG